MSTLFRVLLRLYPREFRARYGDEMWVHYRTRLERARGRGRLVRLQVWWTTTFDVLASAVAERSSTGAAPDGVEGETMMGAAWEVLSGAARRLLRAPGFTLVAVAIAGLGIAVNVTVFTVVDAFLFRPPPWDQPDRVVRIYQDSDDGDPNSTSFPAYRDMAATEGVFEAVGAATPATVTWDAAAGPRPLAAEFITASYLQVLGLQPALGRWFEPAYDHVGAGYYAVLGYNTWQSAFGGDPDVVGTTLRLNGSPVTVVGVAPQELTSTTEPMVTDVFLSVSSVELGGAFRVPNLDAREDHWYQVRARLAPGVSVEQARSAMDALATRLGEDYPEVNRGRQISVFTYKQVRLHPDVDGGLYPAAGLLMVLVGLVLALACSNLANLLLARGMAREGEVAVRRAMGASRARVTWLFLTEALLVATLSGVVGVALASQALRLVPLIPLPLPVSGELSLPMDGRVILFALGLVLFTGLLVGLAPALRSGRRDVAGSLRNDSRSATAGKRSRRFRSALVGVQVGASVVLLVVSGLVLRSFLNQNGADPGVAVDGVAYLGTDLSAGDRPVPERFVLLRQIEQRLAAAPGIEAVGAATRLPVTSSGGSTTTVVEGYTPPSGTDAVELMFNLVDPGYFEALDIPLVAGRYFNADDGPDQSMVVILSKAAADRFWPGQNPIGRRVRGQGSENWREVIGVVDDVRRRLLRDPLGVRAWASVRCPGGASQRSLHALQRRLTNQLRQLFHESIHALANAAIEIVMFGILQPIRGCSRRDGLAESRGAVQRGSAQRRSRDALRAT